MRAAWVCLAGVLGVSAALGGSFDLGELNRAEAGIMGFASRDSAVAPGTYTSRGEEFGTITFSTNEPSAEPTIGVTHDGAVFVSAWGEDRIDVLRSTDDGRQWEVVSPRLSGDENTHVLSLDPYLYVDPDTSRIFTIDLTVACSIVSFSDDRGDSWTTNPLGCGRPINDHQTVFAGPPVTSQVVNYPNVVYYCWNDILTSSCSKSLDGGLTFASTGAPAFVGVLQEGQEDAKHCGGLHGHGAASSDGTIYLPREFCGRAMVAISRDEGLTWEVAEVSKRHLEGTDPSVAVDAKGNLYYAWLSVDRLPYLATSTDDGRTWSKPHRVSSRAVQEANLVSLAVGDPGKVALVFMGSRNSGFQKCFRSGSCYEKPYSDVTWNGYMAFSRDALSPTPTFDRVMVNSTSDPLKVGRCGPGRCGGAYDFLDVVIDGRGTAFGAFVDLAYGSIASRPVGLVARSMGPRLRSGTESSSSVASSSAGGI